MRNPELRYLREMYPEMNPGPEDYQRYRHEAGYLSQAEFEHAWLLVAPVVFANLERSLEFLEDFLLQQLDVALGLVGSDADLILELAYEHVHKTRASSDSRFRMERIRADNTPPIQLEAPTLEQALHVTPGFGMA